MHDPNAPGLINALLANRADTPVPARPLTLSALSRGLLGLDSNPGALSSFLTPQPRQLGALAQLFAESEHDRLLEKLRARLVANLYSDIKVDLPGYVKPDRIVWTDTQRGHEPDATAYYLMKQHVFEVETADSLGDEHTYEQCRLFAAYVRDKFAEFTLIVPSGSGFAARSQLHRWGLSATVLEI
ncbi:MAG: hypothetical protein A3H97_24030 [Acidobacteria bacterium RIFCSPLOWO2_02_FULL_65_29]|nr:MAG: hypothetical protein A3H97_24030 [Acidobacteria bacterium RIFCSPLOWO2_02_FULL_65_29]